MRPCNVAIVSSSPQGMKSWSSRIKNCFYKLIESIIKKICHDVKQNAKKNVPLVKQNVMKLEVFIKTKN